MFSQICRNIYIYIILVMLQNKFESYRKSNKLSKSLPFHKCIELLMCHVSNVAVGQGHV